MTATLSLMEMLPGVLLDAPEARREASEHEFASFDGTKLFYRAWLPAGGVRAGKAVLLLHRGHEHSGRWSELVDALSRREDFADVAFFAHDARGHGRSPGERG